MVRPYNPSEYKKHNPFYIIGYIFCVLLICCGWVMGYRLFFARYDDLHPEITWAVPGNVTTVIDVPGVLLWREICVRSSIRGNVYYPKGTGPVQVGKGQTVAIIKNGGKTRYVRAQQCGFFIAGLDGHEKRWKYSELWSGQGPIPEPYKLKIFKSGTLFNKGDIIGKIVLQPQSVRFIGYAREKGDFNKQLAERRLRLILESGDTGSLAELRVAKKAGSRKKIYVTLPWFPGDILKSRKYSLKIEAGRKKGVLVPESAVQIDKNGKMKIYLVQGQRLVQKKVGGCMADKGNILITKGLSVGDALAKNASEVREGRIQLW